MGLRLSEEKTGICHIDEGFAFLGWRIQRQIKQWDEGNAIRVHLAVEEGSCLNQSQSARDHTAVNNHPLDHILNQLNLAVRGWTNYFRHGVSSATFAYLGQFTWRRVICWFAISIVGPTGGSFGGAISKMVARAGR